MIERGQVWWADLDEPVGSELGYRRPVVIMQADEFNQSRLPTVIVVGVTGNLRLRQAGGNVFVTAGTGGLPRDSVINVSQLGTMDRSFLIEQIGLLPREIMREVEKGLRVILAL